ncbi:O-succinylbenzoic acid--CoA ligase [Flavobacterium akiainvivens]|uniref:O-succinylbenzoic acid--CoA ligase n=1 Tax=Flavobacterium akiainvivens TaxID=1202724 RepID=A0A0N0RQD5_9FLAO|nr:AMP-binding protein [Flavobacterium akiainvivens]KOS04922.1 O-succinylbenzoic acid--CoA ligase [Flavobacterium akiainvivens]SFQ42098.1 O-succinylbenzoic acid--CoA ligase [Flavobacterium akiainvivens]
MEITPDFIHPSFCLNGISLNAESLWSVAYSFIKEGEEYQKHIGLFILDWLDGNDFVPMQTSGTTGTPKPIRVSKQAMVQSALATGAYFDLPAGTRALHCLPAQFVAGKMMLVRAILLGWHIDVTAPASRPLDNCKGNYDFSALVPLQAEASLSELHRVKKTILGGAKVGPELSRQLQELPVNVYETYGMTETVTHIAAKKVGQPAFETLPGVTVEADDRNCLVINAPRVADKPVVTNDVVEVLGENRFVWLGRVDNVINSGGIKLHPEQIEEKLAAILNNRRYFITTVPDDVLGNKLVLVIEGEPFTIATKQFDVLGRYEKPKEIYFVKQFTETGSGKIRRTETLNIALNKNEG